MDNGIAVMENSLAEEALRLIREATLGTRYESNLYLVGGALRDRILGVPHGSDLDLVLEGDALALAQHLHRKGLSSHYPVLYPRFGTAMIHLEIGGVEPPQGIDVELVTARAESYNADSRKPNVTAGTLKQDIYRRDFTINTLAQNLHTGELHDITGMALSDLEAGIIRTPVAPQITFFDDPLRMLRAVRFAARFEFEIEPETWKSIVAESARLRPPQIALERIREEFEKIAMLPGARFRSGIELLLESGLLSEFLPEMLPMLGCTQGDWHRYDVWSHTLLALEALPREAPLSVRLGVLWHDIGKPPTRTVDGQGVHFYGHPSVGSALVRTMMNRLKFPNDVIREVTSLVEMHMRLGAYRPEWDDPAVKRLIRDTYGILDELFVLTECDMSAVEIPEDQKTDLQTLRGRVDGLLSAVTIESPLDGNEIMRLLGVGPGPHLKEAKELLVNAVIDGRIDPTNPAEAEQILGSWWAERNR